MRGPNGDEMQAELTGGSRVASGPDSDVALAMHGASDTTTASQQVAASLLHGQRLAER